MSNGSGRPGPVAASLPALLASSALSGVAVLALVGVLILAFGQPTDTGTARAAGGLENPGTADSGPGGSDAPGVDPMHGGVSAAPTPDPGAASAPSPRTPGFTPEPTAVADAPTRPAPASAVVVFNQTTQPGLAAAFRAQLRQAGWDVPAIGDWVGNVPASTVYYPTGMLREARLLMRAFPDIGRIRPAFPGIPTTKLTVILAGEQAWLTDRDGGARAASGVRGG